MPKITVNKERCKGCLLCISFCPRGSLVADDHLSRKGIRPVSFKKGAQCLGCTRCALICPDCCIEVYK